MTLANVGLPLLPLHWAFAIVGFVPVVAIETWVLRRRLEATWGRGLVVTITANLVTTILGVPIALLLYLFGLYTVEFVAPDVVPRAGWFRFLEDVAWLYGPDFRKYPVAVAVLLIPSLYVSILVERPIVRAMLRAERSAAKRAVRSANFASYSLLFLVCLGWFVATGGTEVGLTFRQAETLVGQAYQSDWGGCFPDHETRPGYSQVVDRGGFFGPSRLELRLCVTKSIEQECIASDVLRRLEELSAGPFTLLFVAPVEHAKQPDGSWVTTGGEVLHEIRLDGRSDASGAAAFLSPDDESEH